MDNKINFYLRFSILSIIEHVGRFIRLISFCHIEVIITRRFATLCSCNTFSFSVGFAHRYLIVSHTLIRRRRTPTMNLLWCFGTMRFLGLFRSMRHWRMQIHFVDHHTWLWQEVLFAIDVHAVKIVVMVRLLVWANCVAHWHLQPRLNDTLIFGNEYSISLGSFEDLIHGGLLIWACWWSYLLICVIVNIVLWLSVDVL